MSRGKGAKVPFLVYVSQSVSEVVRVEAETIAEAIELAEGEADTPNVSNQFEAEGEPRAMIVMDTGGNQLWHVDDDGGE